MLCAILAYHPEGAISGMTPDQNAVLMSRVNVVHDRLTAQGTLGPAARLDFPTAAVTLRGPGEGAVIDGPFAETKEQLLGLYVLDCASMDEAIAAARDLRKANPTAVYEIRPILSYRPPGEAFQPEA